MLVLGEAAGITGCDMVPLERLWMAFHSPQPACAPGLRACGFGPGRGEGSVTPPCAAVEHGGQSACSWTWLLPGRATGRTGQGSQGASVSGGTTPVWLASSAPLVNSGKCGPRSLGGKRDVWSLLEVAVDPELEDPTLKHSTSCFLPLVQGTRADWDLVLPATCLST